MIGLRSSIQSGTHVTNSALLGVDFYEDSPPESVPVLDLGRNVVLECTIVDKNARIGDGTRFVSARRVEKKDGDGYYIRGRIIIVPKGGIVPPGFQT